MEGSGAEKLGDGRLPPLCEVPQVAELGGGEWELSAATLGDARPTRKLDGVVLLHGSPCGDLLKDHHDTAVRLDRTRPLRPPGDVQPHAHNASMCWRPTHKGPRPKWPRTGTRSRSAPENLGAPPLFGAFLPPSRFDFSPPRCERAYRVALIEMDEPDDKLDALVARLNETERETGWDRTLTLGETVIHEMWGSVEQYVSLPDGEARRSYRSVAKHPALAFGATTLYYAVVCTVLLDRLQREGIDVRERLSPSHVRHLHGLPLIDQVDLANRAILLAWNTRRIEQEARKARRQYRGETKMPLYEKDLRRVERWGRSVVFDPDALFELDGLDLDDLDNLAARLEWAEHLIGQRMARLRVAIKTRGGKLRKLPRHRRPRRKSGLSYGEIVRNVAASSTRAA